MQVNSEVKAMHFERCLQEERSTRTVACGPTDAPFSATHVHTECTTTQSPANWLASNYWVRPRHAPVEPGGGLHLEAAVLVGRQVVKLQHLAGLIIGAQVGAVGKRLLSDCRYAPINVALQGQATHSTTETGTWGSTKADTAQWCCQAATFWPATCQPACSAPRLVLLMPAPAG